MCFLFIYLKFAFFDKSLYQYVGISVVNSSAMTVSAKYTLYHCKDSVSNRHLYKL